jgi:hypothetical protein
MHPLIINEEIIISADPNVLTVYGKYCLRPLEYWDRGFEYHSKHVCVSA